MNKKSFVKNAPYYLSIFLWLVAVHSLLVGIGLILLPASLIDFLGYDNCAERFFPSQGGVFHIAMAVGYALAAYDTKHFECLVIFSIIVKFIATIFLLIYFILISPILLILISCISDFLMGLIIFSIFQISKQTE